MKTPEQIVDYLKKADFYLAFKLAYEEQRGRPISLLFKSILNDEIYAPEIINAYLSWGRTIEGANFWSAVHTEFKKWLYEDEVSELTTRYRDKNPDSFSKWHAIFDKAEAHPIAAEPIVEEGLPQ